MAATINLGYPRIGPRRELKRALEGYWKGTLDTEQLRRTASEIRTQNWAAQRAAGTDLIPSNDSSLNHKALDIIGLPGAAARPDGWAGRAFACALSLAPAPG